MYCRKTLRLTSRGSNCQAGGERFLHIVTYAPEEGFEGSIVEEWTVIGSSGRENLQEVGRPHWNVVGQCDEGTDDLVVGDKGAFK